MSDEEKRVASSERRDEGDLHSSPLATSHSSLPVSSPLAASHSSLLVSSQLATRHSSLVRDLAAYDNSDFEPGRGVIIRLVWYYVSLLLFESGWFVFD